MSEAIAGPTCLDAVVILPGIMGSELVDVTTGHVLWGIADPGWYVSAWTTGNSLRRLAVTDEERAGTTGRIKATRPLTTPAAVPVFHGVEPYTRLVSAVRRVAAHPDAVLLFAYDWRLSIEHNARQLAREAGCHLEQWRAHPYWREHQDDRDDVRLTLVAHSMGGLVAQYFVNEFGGADLVRTTITLGTPFYGAVKAAYTLSTGRDGPLPLPRHRLRTLARTMPGLYDLLPSYRCVVEGADARRLTPADVAAIGGDAGLAEESLARHERLLAGHGHNIRPFVGVDQPTMQSMAISDGVVEPLYYTWEQRAGGRVAQADYAGDSTVYRKASFHQGTTASYVPQTHTALAKTDEAIAHVRAILTEDVLGPRLPGDTVIGIDVPDVVTVGVDFELAVVTLDDPTAADCWIVDVATNTPLPPPMLLERDRCLRASIRLDRCGIYRIEVKGGGYSAVSQLVMAVPPADLTEAG